MAGRRAPRRRAHGAKDRRVPGRYRLRYLLHMPQPFLFARMLRRVFALLPLLVAGAAAAQGWRTVPLPDGSGQLRLPDGYRILAASQGGVDIVGAEGQMCSMGAAIPVITPQGAQGMFANQLLFVAPYGDPATSLVRLFPIISRVTQMQGMPAIALVRIVEQTPAAFPGGQAAFIHYEFDRGNGGRTVREEAVSLIITAPTGPTSWLFYCSNVSTPQERFAQDLPVLMQIWASWKVSDSVYQKRLIGAMQSMRDCNKIMRDTIARRQEVFDNANADWDEYIRGSRGVVNDVTGERVEVHPNDGTRAEDELNRTGGAGTWHQEDPRRR